MDFQGICIILHIYCLACSQTRLSVTIFKYMIPPISYSLIVIHSSVDTDRNASIGRNILQPKEKKSRTAGNNHDNARLQFPLSFFYL